MRMVVGLGNPGVRYRNTRHNLGFRVVDRLAGLLDAVPVPTEVPAEVARVPGEPPVWLVKPLTFMNLSGRAVTLLREQPGLAGLTPDGCLVVLDDIYLPFGKLRLRLSGSDGGHNGLASMIDAFGTPGVPRLRIGVGPVPEGADLKEFVLEGLSGELLEEADRVVDRAAACARDCLEHGVLKAMDRCNG